MHLRNRLARKAVELNYAKVKMSTDGVEITKQVSQHPCDRLAWKVKQLNEAADKILLTKVIPQHPRGRFRRKVKESNDKISFIKKVPQHPRSKLVLKVKELNQVTDKMLLKQLTKFW